MRHEMTGCEWKIFQPVLPDKPRDVPRVNDRRVPIGIVWTLRSGAPWRDPPECVGHSATCDNRFNRWRKAGVWDNILAAVTDRRDADVQMLDTTIVRVHQHGSRGKRTPALNVSCSRGGLTTKIHAVIDAPTRSAPGADALPSAQPTCDPPGAEDLCMKTEKAQHGRRAQGIRKDLRHRP